MFVLQMVGFFVDVLRVQSWKLTRNFYSRGINITFSFSNSFVYKETHLLITCSFSNKLF